MAKVRAVTNGAPSADGTGAETVSSSATGASTTGSQKTKTVTDVLGRRITVKTFSAVERMRFLRMVGEHGQGHYGNYAAVAAAVRQVDDQTFPHLPASIMQLEAKVGMLDDPGMEAAALALQDIMPQPLTQEELDAAAKK